MSAGEFESARYETNAGGIHPIRVQEETLSLTLGGTANAAPAGAFTSGISARVSGGRRQLGLTARNVTLRWTGAVPDNYDPDGLLRVPILTPALFNSLSRGVTGTYLESPVEVVGTSPESIR